jgi:predicted AAA+ superfamily ATPase
MKNRVLRDVLARRLSSPAGRVVLVTGARQTGKTTLGRQVCPDFAYFSFDDPVLRPQFLRKSAAEWLASGKRFFFDEVQKAPPIFDTVKAMVDMDPACRVVLSGSSQILLLEKVRESLAGWISLLQLDPLTLPELVTQGWESPVGVSRLCQFLESPESGFGPFSGIPQADAGFARTEAAWRRQLEFGGMPILWNAPFLDTPEDCRQWLKDYVSTYLQRDIRDLAALRELEPFVRAQKALASQTSGVVNMANLARDAGVSPSTAARFLNYLEISYQLILLRPWARNNAKRLTRAPKAHLSDTGVLRAVLDRRGTLSGGEFESAVVSEILRQLKCRGIPAAPHYLRTHDGLEVDLLLELEDGFVGIEVKQGERVTRHDARHLHSAAAILDKPLLAGLVLSSDPEPQVFSDTLRAYPVAWALGNA